MEKVVLENEICFLEDGKKLAYITFPYINENVVVINHTVVDPILQGQGVASKLVMACYEELKSRGLKAKLECSYAISWFEKHKEYNDILHR